MSESNEEYDGCFPSSTYSTLVTGIFGGISLFGVLLVVIAGSILAYRKTQSKILQKQIQYEIKSEQTLKHKEKKNNIDSKPQNTNMNESQNGNCNYNTNDDENKESKILRERLKQKFESKESLVAITEDDDGNNIIEENGKNSSDSQITLKLHHEEKTEVADTQDIDIVTSGDGDTYNYGNINTNVNIGKFKCLKWFCTSLPKAILARKRCYLPVITHTIDQATDIGVIIQFYQIYKYENDNNVDCNRINGGYLFFNSIFAFSFYRIISSIWIYNLTGGKIIDTILQIFDLKLYHALYINFEQNNIEPNSPQRYLMLLESTLESFPQCVIQLYYFIRVGKSGLTSENIIVIISLITSILNVSSKMISEDRIYFVDRWRRSEFKLSPFHINYRYVIRFIVRLIDFINRLIFILLIWIILGGMMLYIYLIFDVIFLVGICIVCKRLVLYSRVLFCFLFLLYFHLVFLVL